MYRGSSHIDTVPAKSNMFKTVAVMDKYEVDSSDAEQPGYDGNGGGPQTNFVGQRPKSKEVNLLEKKIQTTSFQNVLESGICSCSCPSWPSASTTP